ncbi:MAG: hypothetical protein IPN13_11300 [Bacteroidetes bacterium]|nr:hypothetical protein [Bacteroidota bacterium]
MAKRWFVVCLVLLLKIPTVQSSTNFGGLDSVADINCDTTVFYGVVGADVHRLQKVGTVILDIGVIAPSSFGSMYGLGFAGDFMNGSMNRTFMQHTWEVMKLQNIPALHGYLLPMIQICITILPVMETTFTYNMLLPAL